MQLKDGMEAEYAEYVANNSKDGYSKGVVDYGEKWADLMEKRIAELEAASKAYGVVGEYARVTRFAEAVQPSKCSHEADTDGITGFMYGCAAQALAHFWKHGEILRRWHNIDTQMRDEGEKANASGGVLNPALVNIG